MKSNKTDFLFILAGALLFLLIALYNGYPFVYSDTGTYTRSGFLGFVPIDRPIAYGLFIRHMSMKASMWYVVIVQDILLSFVLFELFKLLVKKSFKKWFLLSVFLISLTTAVAWCSNQLLPDVFVGIMFIALYVLLFTKSISLVKALIFSVLILFSELCHFSHLLMATTLMVILIIARGLDWGLRKELTISRLITVSALVFSAWLILPTINVLHGSRFSLSEGSHVFMMAHLNAKGVLKEYLDEHCDEHPEMSLCGLKDELPNEVALFIWDHELSQKYGGFEKSKEEFDFIINEIMYDPAYLWDNIRISFLYGLTQVSYNKVGEGFGQHFDDSAPYIAIDRFIKNKEADVMLNSRQNRLNGNMPVLFEFLTTVQWIVLYTSLFILIYALLSMKFLLFDQQSHFLILFVLIVIFLNSLYTAGLSMPYARYSSRLVWLFPISVIIVCLNNWKSLIKNVKES